MKKKKTPKNKLANKYSDWLPLKSEIGDDGNAIPSFEDDGGAYENRVFPQFTLKNIKTRFNTDVFLRVLKKEKDAKIALVMALNADEELKYAFGYHDALPESHLTIPAYTSGSLYNYLDKDLTFTTIYRKSSAILTLSESFEKCIGYLSSKKRKKNFLLRYTSNRDGTTDCFMIKEFAYTKFEKNIAKFVNKDLLIGLSPDYYGLSAASPDTLILNKDFEFDIKKIIKRLKPLAEEKRKEVMAFATEDEMKRKKELQKAIGTHIYLLSHKQIKEQISKSRMDGSVLFQFPIKKGRQDISQQPIASTVSDIDLDYYCFVFSD